MKIAILGRQPKIGMAELESVFGGKSISPILSDVCLVETEKLNVSHFGSVLKTGHLFFEVKSTEWRTISGELVRAFVRDFFEANGKLTLGVSVYGKQISPNEIQKTNQIIKQKLKQKNISVRTIPSKASTLSTAVSHNNKLGLSNKKVEVLVIILKNKTFVALSEGSQNITAYARRDQNRPMRDAFIGMLPPKLAQTMTNLAVGENQPQISPEVRNESLSILDPFCGTGTVLQEAQLKGFDTFGTDLNPKMIDFTRKNLEWFEENFRPHGKMQDLEVADATNFTWEFAKNLSSVVCETYLGQPFSAPPSPKKLLEVRENCNRIVSNFLKNLASQIPEGTQVCIAVPAWKQQNGYFSHLPLLDFLDQLGYTRKEFMRVNPQDLLYYREDQVVARELLVLIRSKNVKS